MGGRGGGGGSGGGGGGSGGKLQALVYDILPWRKVPESDARSVERRMSWLTPRCLQKGLGNCGSIPGRH